MSDIFISYAKEDRHIVRRFAQALEQQGWTVFWDPVILAGKTWRDAIYNEIESAPCVVVAWSSKSTRSHWVLEESEIGRRRGILIPVLIEDVLPPIGFQSLQAADLADWNGATTSPAFTRLVSAIEEILGPAPVSVKSRRKGELTGKAHEEKPKESEVLRRQETAPSLHKVPGKWQSPTFYVAILLRSLCYGALVGFAFAYYENIEWNTYSPEFVEPLYTNLWGSFGMGIGTVLVLELSEELIMSGVSIKIVGILAPVLMLLAGGMGSMLAPDGGISDSSQLMMFSSIVGCAAGAYGAKRYKNESRALRFAGASAGAFIGAILCLLILILTENWGSRGSSLIYWYKFLSGVLPGSVVSIRVLLPRPMGVD